MIYMFYFFEAKLWFDLREVRDDVSCYFWEMIYVYETFVLVHRTLEGVIRSSLLLFSVLLSKDQGYFCNNKQLDHFCKNPLLIPPLAIIRNSKERILQQTFKTQKTGSDTEFAPFKNTIEIYQMMHGILIIGHGQCLRKLHQTFVIWEEGKKDKAKKYSISIWSLVKWHFDLAWKLVNTTFSLFRPFRHFLLLWTH